MDFLDRNTMPQRLLAALFIFLLLTTGLAAQQETGRITGTVKDQSGAVVPSATLTVRNVATNAQRTASTGNDGSYVVTNLQPGTYEVTAAMTGFNTAKKQIAVTVGGAITVDFPLTVGAAPTTVVVSDTAMQVNIESQNLSNVITTKQILDLPTLTRNPYDLVAISGNASPIDPRDVAAGANRGVGFSLNGQRSSSTNVLLDGADNNDTYTANVGQSVPLDSVQEFSVVTSTFTAEYGRASGGVVNVATKSGSNEFHGSAYEFNRVSKLASNGFDNNAQGIPRGIFARNQFGFSVGGPIKKDKLFFFNNTEWFRVRSSSTETALVPTPQLIAAAAPATRQFFSTLGGNLKVQPNGVIYTKSQIPGLCNPTGPCANLAPSMPVWATVNYPVPADAGGGDPQNQYQTVSRIDYNISDKTTIYGRFARQSQDIFAGTNSNSPYAGYDSGTTNRNNNALVSITHTFSPKLVSQAKIVYNRLTNTQPLGDVPVSPGLYFSAANTASKILGFKIALPGYLPYSPGNAIPFGGPQNLAQVYEDLSWIHGTHTFRFGGNYIYLRDNRAFGAYEEAVEQLGANTAQAMDNFLLGQLINFQTAVNPQGKFPRQTLTLPVGAPDFTRSNRYSDFAFYAQDTWRFRPRLTLNLGVRWEYYGVQHNKDPYKDSNYYPGSGTTVAQQIANGSVLLAPNSPIGGLWAKDLNNFAPRLGFAWDVSGNGKTSLRGGYGISYERNFGNVTFNVIQNPPNYAVVSIGPGDVGGNLPVTTANAGPLAGSTGTKVLPITSLRAVNPNMKTAYAHFWSGALEHEITKSAVLSLEYTGSKGVGLYSIDRENLPGSANVFLKTPGSSTRLNPQYSAINYRTADGFSNYNAMIAEVRSQNLFKSGLGLTFNYTYAHALDNLSSTFSELGNNIYNLGLLDPTNPSLDKGNADFDIRHRLSLSGIWDVPFAKNMKGPARQILGGWSFAPIITAHTGAPFTVWDCSNPTGSGLCNRMLVVSASALKTTNSGTLTPIPNAPNQFTYLDLSAQASGVGAYVNPITGTSDFGPYPSNMTGRNVFRQPGAWDFNLGAYKSFKLPKEGTSIQFRAEFYNVFNHSNLYADVTSTDISSSTTVPALKGASGTASERRNIQFALKFIF
jgi:outer membrane receptor protein involved in Fe transport